MREPEYQPEVTMYVRSLNPTGADHQQRELIERLRTMDGRGDIAGFSVVIWGERIPCDAQTSVGTSILDRIETFEAWSDRAGTSLAPFFETRRSGSLLTEDTHECIVPPTLCIAEFDDETLQHVAPCIDDGMVRTVADRLDVIERGVRNGSQSRATSD